MTELNFATPPVVSKQKWEAAWEKLLVREKEVTRARDALAAERRRMPWLAVEKDYVFEGPDGAKIFVDRKSLLFLKGTVLDYDTNMIGKGFVFNNPNAKTSCGCGSSFGA